MNKFVSLFVLTKIEVEFILLFFIWLRVQSGTNFPYNASVLGLFFLQYKNISLLNF